MPLRDATLYRDRLLAADTPAEAPDEGARWVVSFDNLRNGSGHAPDDARVVPGWPDGEVVQAFAHRGSWLAKCRCGSAALACQTDPRFFCIDCGNIEVEGAWLVVEWPEDVDAIEEILMKRMYRVNKNWTPGETLADLQAENDEHTQVLSR
jgi:hypothetical protein